MDLATDRVPESAYAFEPTPVGALFGLESAEPVADPHVEINARRAAVENPEMLRRLRSL
jgi:hypothetical protein